MKPLTPAEVGQIAEDLIVTYMGHAAPPAVLDVDPRMGIKVLVMLHSKVVLALAHASDVEHAYRTLESMAGQLLDKLQAAQPANDPGPRIVQPMPPAVQ